MEGEVTILALGNGEKIIGTVVGGTENPSANIYEPLLVEISSEGTPKFAPLIEVSWLKFSGDHRYIELRAPWVYRIPPSQEARDAYYAARKQFYSKHN